MAGSGLALSSGMHEAETRVAGPRAFPFSAVVRASSDPSWMILTAGFDMEDSSSHLSALVPVVSGIQTDPATSEARTGIVPMPELDFAALVPIVPGMLMEAPYTGKGKNTVRFNLLPEIQVYEPFAPAFDPPVHLFLQKEMEARSVFSTVELMLKARKLLKRARSTFHVTRPSQNAVSVLV
ncbi:unnamed protein product [Polarella glacialis]|uniref:Uncharacterized protein n=1 Tax=Polarella glacialis TaxID=89957 RepID=A0A813GY28_POLGL|nr:unnamed protein product [Polarella glacialis]